MNTRRFPPTAQLGQKPDYRQPRLSTAEAAAWLQVSVELLRKWRQKEMGPVYFNLPPANGNGRVSYYTHDLERFVEARTARHGPKRPPTGISDEC